MLPINPQNDQIHGVKVDPELASDGPLVQLSHCVDSSDFFDLFLSQFVSRVLFSRLRDRLEPSSFLHRVSNIIGGRSKKKMPIITTRRVIAVVAAIQGYIKFTVVKAVRYAVGLPCLTPKTEHAVQCISILRSNPWPTLILSPYVHLGPKTLFNFGKCIKPFNVLSKSRSTGNFKWSNLFHSFGLSRMGYWPCGTFSLCANLQRKAILCL